MENNVASTNAGQGLGIAALVLGILAVVAAFIPCFGLIAIFFGVLAIVFGAIGLSQAKNGNGSVTMPKAGLILGIVATAFVIVWMLLIVGTFGKAIIDNKDEINNTLDSLKYEVKENNDSLDIIQDSIKVNE